MTHPVLSGGTVGVSVAEAMVSPKQGVFRNESAGVGALRFVVMDVWPLRLHIFALPNGTCSL